MVLKPPAFSGVGVTLEKSEHRSNLLTLVSELLNNSLDHGVLGLDSSLKNQPEGFSLYYQERKKCLAFLEKGWIRVDMEHTPLEKGGRFTVVFEDSGPGFDYGEALALSPDLDPTQFSGRGIKMSPAKENDGKMKGNRREHRGRNDGAPSRSLPSS